MTQLDTIQHKTTILSVAIAVPFRRCFDYLPPKNTATMDWQAGMRVRVPFGHRRLVGVLMAVKQHTSIAVAKLKAIDEVLDEQAILTPPILRLARWASDYYHYPLGEVLASVLPTLLCQGKPAVFTQQTWWRLTQDGRNCDISQLTRAPKQRVLLSYLQQFPDGVSHDTLKTQDFSTTTINALVKKHYVETISQRLVEEKKHQATESCLTLNEEQQIAYETIAADLNHFQTFLLDGVTGSGKTEIYLQVIADIIKNKKQALVLVPEIGLTPQTVARFERRFSEPVAVLHSNLNNNERLQVWLKAKHNEAKIIIGTRSALFTPLPDLGLIILDEEHDLSFKQQEGFRYSARDLAIVRGQFENVPVILGSATPSLETLLNVKQKRYQHLILRQRAGKAIQPNFQLIDIRKKTLQQGLSDELLSAIQQHLNNQQQVLLFLNRRGYAPVLMCHECAWIAGCVRCDARLTLHAADKRLHCHHCDTAKYLPRHCPECRSDQLFPIGLGTQRLEEVLQEKFPDVDIVRVDRDSTRRKGELQKILASINEGKPQILLGTQMLAKGHHFPNVTLVGLLDIDSGFFSADFRTTERSAQLITQVAGRAGRGEKVGDVYLQTYHPEHPLLQTLIKKSYADFAEAALTERQQACLPPQAFLALLRAETPNKDLALAFLREVRDLAREISITNVNVLGPIPAPMEKRAGRYRAQLLLQSLERKALQQLLHTLTPKIEVLKSSRKVRWNLDVDPQEMF